MQQKQFFLVKFEQVGINSILSTILSLHSIIFITIHFSPRFGKPVDSFRKFEKCWCLANMFFIGADHVEFGETSRDSDGYPVDEVDNAKQSPLISE